MRETLEVLEVSIDRVTLSQAEQATWDFLKQDKAHMIFTPNSEIIMVAQQDKELKDVLNSGDLIIADGIGVVYASKILKKPIAERVAGFDLAKQIIEKLPQKEHKLYFLGGKPGVAKAAKDNLEKQYPGIQIVGTHDGYFDEEQEAEIIHEINQLKPDILFVCLGMGKQEKWIYNHRGKLSVKVCMGIGGSLDVFAGRVQRAPDFYCKYGLEWFYRLVKEPWRYKRMLALPKFALMVLLKGKRQACNSEEGTS